MDFLFPAAPSSLAAVSHLAIEGALGNLDEEKDQVITPERILDSQKEAVEAEKLSEFLREYNIN